jgi:hypothetical protein
METFVLFLPLESRMMHFRIDYISNSDSKIIMALYNDIISAGIGCGPFATPNLRTGRYLEQS